MHEADDDNANTAQGLSALADGELDAGAIRATCVHWSGDGEARARWHAYHLIGDVLRSDALASDAAHDEHFLQTLRARLAAEPSVLAPRPLPLPSPAASRSRPRFKWLAPAAVAAGFMIFASLLVVTRGPLPASGGEGPMLAAAPGRMVVAAAPPAAVAAVAGEGLVAPQTVADRQFVRDARFDRYLAAHMEFGGSSALGAPSGFLRTAAALAPDR